VNIQIELDWIGSAKIDPCPCDQTETVLRIKSGGSVQ